MVGFVCVIKEFCCGCIIGIGLIIYRFLFWKEDLSFGVKFFSGLCGYFFIGLFLII